MADEVMIARVEGRPVPQFDDPAFNTDAPALKDATVAIVTTAGLRKEGDAAWNPFDKSFRNFDKADRDMQLGHLSPNFDRSGFAADLNVVYPIDRLEEMAEEGVIGQVADTHLSFMGAQDETMSSIRMDTGPAAAKLLKDQGTDIVLLTPI